MSTPMVIFVTLDGLRFPPQPCPWARSDEIVRPFTVQPAFDPEKHEPPAVRRYRFTGYTHKGELVYLEIAAGGVRSAEPAAPAGNQPEEEG